MAEDSLESLGRRMNATSRVHLRVAEFAGGTAALEAQLRAVPGVQAIASRSAGVFEIDTNGAKDVTPSLARVAVSAGLIELREETFNLEDVFLKLTTSEENQGVNDMRGAFTIAGKDLRNMFMSPLFYVISGICSLLWWVLFAVSVAEFNKQSFMQMMQGQGGEGMSLHFYVVLNHFRVVNLIMIFFVGAITMRLFTDEKRNRTYDLLLTSPVTATDIALGKLIAGVATAWALILLSCLYPASLGFFAKMDWGAFASSTIGMMLLTAAYVAIGMFASSITQSPAVAVILALIFNVALWFVGALAESVGDPSEKAVFDHLNVGTHLQTFINGNFTLSGVVFFLSLVFLFTFLTQRVVESARWR